MSKPNWIAYRDLSEPHQAIAYLRSIELGAGKHLAALLEKYAFQADMARALLCILYNKTALSSALVPWWRKIICRAPRQTMDCLGVCRSQSTRAALVRKIVRHLEAQASQQGFAQVYLVSQHLGLYEKYGYTLLEKSDEGIHEVDYLYEKTLA